MTKPTREQVVAEAGRLFPGGRGAAVLATLDRYGTESHEVERERVQLAILALSAGDERDLEYLVGAAKTDYRDVLYWLELNSKGPPGKAGVAADIDAEIGAGRVSAESFRTMFAAEVNGQASTMLWLEKRLRHLRRVVLGGREVTVEETGRTVRLTTEADFRVWCARALPDAHGCFFAKGQDEAMGGATGPETVVRDFIRAMNAWELAAWAASRRAKDTPDPGSYWPEVNAGLDEVFARFCTPRERPQGRAGSFQRPPEYDPENERILGSEISGDKARVDTERKAILGGGPHRYTLHRRGGEWRIDNLKRQEDGKWVRAIL